MPVPSQGSLRFSVFRLLTDFVCLYTYEFWLSLCKIVRSSVILLLPLFSEVAFAHFVQLHICVDIGGIVDHHCSSILFIISQIYFRVRYPRINNVRLLRCCSEFMSYLCLIHVLFMSYLCLIHVLFMSYSCLIYVLFMSYLCLIYVICIYLRILVSNRFWRHLTIARRCH